MELAIYILLASLGAYIFIRAWIKDTYARHDEEMRILRQIRDEKH